MKDFEMESAADTDESYDLGYQPSLSSVDQTDNSPTETTSYSTIGGDSFRHRRMYSEISASSELTYDSSYSDTPSPVCWPTMKSPDLAALKRLGTRPRKLGMDNNPENQEPVDMGKFCYNAAFAVLLFECPCFVLSRYQLLQKLRTKSKNCSRFCLDENTNHSILKIALDRTKCFFGGLVSCNLQNKICLCSKTLNRFR